jgi:hypothetical protein
MQALSSPTLTFDLMDLERLARWQFLAGLSNDERRQLLIGVRRDTGTPYALWQDDPVAFWRMILGGFPWSRQRDLCESVVENLRTVAPASHSVGKSFGAGRLVTWFGSVFPPDVTTIITTAPKMRQVKFILWPHIHRIHTAAGLPGTLDQTQWKIGGRVVAYGFSAGEYDEDAVQGIHDEHVLAVIDEAGGISHTLGNSFESITSGFHTRILAIGNPPTDEEGSWFEECSTSPLWHSIRIPADESPNFTDEDVPSDVKRNLVDKRWVDEQIANFGEGSTFVEARVRAHFPHGATNKTIPWQWIEDAATTEAARDIPPSTWVRLGVDVAADGGDEFVIARATGGAVSIVHFSSGAQNANSTDVAGKVKEAIDEANTIRARLHEERKVRVKIDVIGVGWGVYGTLKAWASEGVIDCELVPVNVSQKATNHEKFYNRRAEMWWAGREAVRPEPGDPANGIPPSGSSVAFVGMDKRTLAQLNAPTYGHDAQGRVKIEKKEEIKKRGLGSPDRAEACLLAIYEPRPTSPGRSYGRQISKATLER